MNIRERVALALVPSILSCLVSPAGQPLREIEAPEGRQGVAVDEWHVYAIGNKVVAKYDKFTGKRLQVWRASEEEPLIHLNSGMVHEGKLICAHSNYSGIPMTSSVEVWDTETLEHVDSHSFGILYGSLTWFDRYDGYWWACFAHYDDNGGYDHKDHTYTTLVKFDDDWRRIESWIFPETVLERFKPDSASGGSWGPDGLLYVSGHDRPELYAMAVPKAGSILRHVRTIPFVNEGQAIAFDRTGTGLLYGIIRGKGLIVADELPAR